jgi:hypothetical protein
MHSSLKKQLAEEANSALRQVQSNIEAEVKSAPVFIQEASSIASKLRGALVGAKNALLRAFISSDKVEDLVLHILAIVVANGGGKTLPIQAAAAACNSKVLKALEELGIDAEFEEGAVISLEMVFGTARCSEYVKEISSQEGAHYVSYKLQNPALDSALDNARHPLPSIIPLKHLADVQANAYRTDNGYRAMLGSKYNDREQEAPVEVLNYLGGIAYSLEEVSHSPRPAPRNKYIDAGGTPSQEVLDSIAYTNAIRTQGSSQACGDLFDMGNKFYFAHSFDFRLRVYSKGYQVSLQGTEWDKSVLEFSNKELLTEEGLQWLRIATANAFGHDKECMAYRVLWVISNADALESLTSEADEPLIYAKCVRALRNAEQGIPIGIPIHMDATASGFQVNGCFTACEETLLVSNVLSNTDHVRVDLYAGILNEMVKADPSLVTLPRKMVKEGTIPAMYASEAEPKRVFGEELVGTFWQAMSKYAGAYWYLKYLPQLWNPNMTEYSFTMPDGYRVYSPVTGTMGEDVFVEMLGDTVHIAQSVQGCKEKSKCFLANITHSFDAYILRNIVRKCKAEGIDIMVIHDSFGTHPNHMAKVVRWYKEELAALVVLNPLQDILEEIFGVRVEIPVFSNLTREELANEILEGEYSLN